MEKKQDEKAKTISMFGVESVLGAFYDEEEKTLKKGGVIPLTT